MNPVLSDWYRWDEGDLVLQLRLQPRAKRSEWAGLQGNAFKIRVNAAPVDGKANAELIAFLAKGFGAGKRDVVIESGFSARIKRVRIESPARIPPELHNFIDRT